ncbi:MAG: hypothetical protein ACI82G_000959 [Bradymonadia bacterium]|jgi:hypothetical protein
MNDVLEEDSFARLVRKRREKAERERGQAGLPKGIEQG